MSQHIVARHAMPLPRYTSYPTANHFSPAIGSGEYATWLAALPDDATLSLYVHIPFCQALCFYCGCTTKAVRRYAPVRDYLDVLAMEIGRAGSFVPGRLVTHIHWGGGSPDIVEAHDIIELAARLRHSFTVDQNAEFAVEIDPRLLAPAQADAFAAACVNRVSIGVQDFAPAVQKAIGREQSYGDTCRAVALFRERGVQSINVDLVYGLPHQTELSLARTLEQVLTLAPDRIAVFGYAHLPSRIKHQRLIDPESLPDAMARYAQSQMLASMLEQAGYVARGLDHFARASDGMASAKLARNFQGYTTDSADALIGLGASAISKLPRGFAQNAVATAEYAARVRDGGLATARGWAMSPDDHIRSWVIERLMCDFDFSASALEAKFGLEAADSMRGIARSVLQDDQDGLVAPTADGFRLTTEGRAFVRNVCARFDAYLAAPAERRHALSV